VKGLVNTSSGEDRLVGDVYQLLVELGKVDEADGLVELVSRLDKQVTAFEDMLEDRDIRIDDLEEEIERKVDRIDSLENELDEVREELELNRRVLG
jgi:chromosome segregation ATPase